MSKVLINILKISIAVGLIYWLVQDGKIDLSQLSLFLDQPKLLAVNILYWVVVAVGFGSLRWHSLLRGVGISIKYLKVALFTLIGFFFNTAMPGAVGGDIIKAIYIIRSEGKNQKTPTLLTILLDRVVGLTGLFTIAFIGVLLNTGLFENPLLQGMAYLTVGIFGALLLFFLAVFIPFGKNDLVAQLLSKNIPGFSIVKKVYDSFCEYRKAPLNLAMAWFLSVLIQGSAILYMWYIATLLGMTSAIEFGVFMSLIPLGVLTTALPLAPGGMGVGHVAFDRILSLVGIEGGANIFNIFFLGQMSLNLLGVFPYLLFKRPTSQEMTEQTSV